MKANTGITELLLNTLKKHLRIFVSLTRAYVDGRNALLNGELRESPPGLDNLEKTNWLCGYDDAQHEQEKRSKRGKH